jgi:competence protein ComEC
MQVTLHGWNYLFTGDLGIEGEHDLYQKYKHIDCDVLKVGHHGSAGSSSVELFEMVHPRIAMIGVGRNNLYGHPTKIVLNRLEERGIMILRTDQDGNFTIRSYGNDHYIFR